MTIALFSNYFNHHQAPLADELFKITGGGFHFIELSSIPPSRVELGYAVLHRQYIIRAWENSEEWSKAMHLARTVDVAIFGGSTKLLPFEKIRLKLNLLTFEYAERWFKKGWINIFSPHLLKSQYYYHTQFYNKPFYKLCASAYTANDLYILHSFKGKCYKWGYFTSLNSIDINTLLASKRKEKMRILWCARFLALKHPELAIKLAKVLKDRNYNFEMNMYGNGKMLEKSKLLAKSLGVLDVVNFMGIVPNAEILKQMREHHIFLFTSDRNEGWGAVVNEAMSNGCTVVGSNEIGSIPFLIKDGENGCIFQSCDLNSLAEKVEMLLQNPHICERYAKDAYRTISNVWSPVKAAENLIQLIKHIKNDKLPLVDEGPCSQAFLM